MDHCFAWLDSGFAMLDSGVVDQLDQQEPFAHVFHINLILFANANTVFQIELWLDRHIEEDTA